MFINIFPYISKFLDIENIIISSYANVIPNFFIYIKISFIILLILAIFYQILNLYILHKFIIMNNKGEEITISPVFPNFIIEYLKDLKLYSKDAEVVKSVKRSYYVQIILYTIMFV